MTYPPFEPLHVGHGPELTLLEYLLRVLLHLVAFGGVAVLVLRLSAVLAAIRSARLRDAIGETDARDG